MEKSKKVKELLRFCVTCLLIVIFFYVMMQKIFCFNIVQQDSMKPNIDGLIVTNRLSYISREPQRGDVIVFYGEDGKNLVKRIIGIPGDKVQIYGGSVFLNDKLLEESYLEEGTITDGNGIYEVPNGMYFVLGDNREVSVDSRYFANTYISKRRIIGRTFFDAHGITNMEFIPRYTLE